MLSASEYYFGGLLDVTKHIKMNQYHFEPIYTPKM